jgi:putative PIN family toxin of toxin-antitoxin system|tara:strand:- start:75 stop:482 length:408 start_codon:yes stop_codon:yes gene_type:complete
MRAILDTNIFLSGIHWSGASNKVLREWFIGSFVSVSSPQINQELFIQLRDFKIRMEIEEIEWWESLILEKFELVVPKRKINVVKDDPDDNKFVETALEGKADYIVTQDKHLLNIKEFEGIKMVTPEEFLRILKTD